MNHIDKTFFGIEPKEQIIIINKALEPLNLIDRFFFIINKLNENFQFHMDLHLLQNKTYDLSKIENHTCNHLFEEFGLNDYSEYLFSELQNIFKILKNRFNISWLEESNNFSLIENYNHLLISRYTYSFWKVIIKQELSVQLRKGNDIKSLKSLIISSLEEIKYRTHLNYTWDIYQEELRSVNKFDIEFEPFFNRQTTSINEDIKWVSNLTQDDVKNQKIIIHEKASKQRLINGINKMIDEDLLSKVKSSKNDKIGYKKEIKKFINYITQKENEKPSNTTPQLNLRFITKPKELYKIFYYCSLNHKEGKDFSFVITKKTEIAKIFDDTLNRSNNDGYSYSSLIRIVEKDNLTKIENGNKPKRNEELLNHEVFYPIRSICNSDILIDFIN